MLGYAGLNRTLRDREEPLRANRSMQQKTWEERGLSYVAELTRQNFEDFLEILHWNVDHGIELYRCSSKLVPWNSQFDLSDLPNDDKISRLAEQIGSYIEENDLRLTFHPDYWCKLASTSEDTVERSLTAVEYHADWLDLLGLDRSPYYGINVHIGATYGDKDATAERFRDAVEQLSPGARSRLTVENDDKSGLWSVAELADVVEPSPVPVVFDYHHHSFTDDGLTYREGFERARSTWDGFRPITHYSEPARLRDGESRPQAHAEMVFDLPDWLATEADVVIEADGKERAVFEARDRLER